MSIRFSLDSRPNQRGEYPIRFTWSYNGPYSANGFQKKVRLQSTIGRSVAKEYWFSPIQRVVCSLKDERYAAMEEINRLLDEMEQKTKQMENRFDWLSRAKMEAYLHEFLKGDEERIADQQLQERQLQTDEETQFRKKGDDRHLYKKIAEARDQATNMKMVIYRRLSGRTLFVASENYFTTEFAPVNKKTAG